MTTNESASEQPTAEFPPVAGPAAPPIQPPGQGTPADYATAPTAHKAHGVEVAIALIVVGFAGLFIAFAAGWTAHGVATHLQARRFPMEQSRFTDPRGDRMMRDGGRRGFGHGCYRAPGADTGRGFGDRQEYVLPEGHPDIGAPNNQDPYDPQRY